MSDFKAKMHQIRFLSGGSLKGLLLSGQVWEGKGTELREGGKGAGGREGGKEKGSRVPDLFSPTLTNDY